MHHMMEASTCTCVEDDKKEYNRVFFSSFFSIYHAHFFVVRIVGTGILTVSWSSVALVAGLYESLPLCLLLVDITEEGHVRRPARFTRPSFWHPFFFFAEG